MYIYNVSHTHITIYISNCISSAVTATLMYIPYTHNPNPNLVLLVLVQANTPKQKLVTAAYPTVWAELLLIHIRVSPTTITLPPLTLS